MYPKISEIDPGINSYIIDDVDVVSENGTYLSHQKVFIHAGIFSNISDKKTEYISVLYQNNKIFDGSSYILFPGLINSHTHVPMSFFKGLSHVPSLFQMDSNQSLIENIFYRLEKFLSPEIIEGLCYPNLIEGLQCGTTTFADSYFFSAEVKKAFINTGINGFISEHFADLGTPHKKGLEKITELENCIKSYNPKNLVNQIVYAHATDTVSQKLLKALVGLAKSYDIPFHMHLSQSYGERERTTEREGKSPVAFANDCDAIYEKSLLTHLVSADKDDLKIIKDRKSHICLCPASEIIYDQLPSLRDIFDSKIPLLLGTDCSASNDGMDISEEVRVLALLAKHEKVSKSLTTTKHYWDMIFNNPYQFFYDRKPLEEGSNADFFLIKKNISIYPVTDIKANFIFSHISKQVDLVFIRGNCLVKNRSYIGKNRSYIQKKYFSSIDQIKKLMKDQFNFCFDGDTKSELFF